jgi:hypothetical protein
MKTLFTFVCIYLPALSFCQRSGLVDSINFAIDTNYIVNLDTLPNFHKFNLLEETPLKPGGLKQIVAVATNADSTTELNKIFILQKKHGDWFIIDSSAAFDAGYLGPYVELKGNYLFVVHNFDQGFIRLQYYFNSSLNRYRLSKIYYNVIQDNYPNNDHSLNLTEEYDIEEQSLTLKSIFRNYSDGAIVKQKTKVISEKLPAGTRLNLSKMKDPYDYDVFLTEGTVYKQMVKY